MRNGLVILSVLLLWNPSGRAGAEEAAGTAPAAAPAAAEGDAPRTLTELPYTHKSPLLAGVLSIVPGMGQIYNEEYFVGGLLFASEVGLYLAAVSYTGAFDSTKKTTLGYESVFFFALAGGIHLLCVFDATWEASRRNEDLDKFSVAVGPDGGFLASYQFRF